MASPFPGMDPYLEPHWLDVHTKLVTYAADVLNQVLPPSFIARTEERVAVETDWVVNLEPTTERFVRIIDASGELVTVIEFLSPTNKQGEGLSLYRQKRAELLGAA